MSIKTELTERNKSNDLKFEDIIKRLYRLETLVWILIAKMGLDGASQLLPLVSAMIN